MLSSQAALIALAIGGNVDCVALSELLAVGLDDIPSSRGLTSLLGGEVGVASRAIPVTRDGLGVKGDLDVEELAGAVHEVA